MASRTLPSERDRKMTILLTPFMSCSAKLPIYSLFAAAFFPQYAGLVMVLLYFTGIAVGVLAALLLKSTVFKGEAVPFVMVYLAYSGRPGPVWLDIPLNVQAAVVETEDLIGFDAESYKAGGTGWAAPSASEIAEDIKGNGEYREILPEPVTHDTARAIIEKIRTSRRPVINAGNGIRIGGAHEVFMRVVEKLGIPVATGADSIDCIYDEHPLYVGKGGNVGDRAGNFAIQNSDLLLSLGSELLPRDVVTRAIREQMEKDGTNFVWLSMAPIEKETILSHFPNIYEHCLEEGYDVTKECIPVVPAQHYFMGGIWVDKNSHTSMPQLFAVGETSCNGVHGANRLASNSLLESLVFAKRAANLIKEQWCLEKEQAV